MKFLTVLILSTALAACGAKSSDEDEVRALIDAVETAAEARDASEVLEHVSDDYSDSAGYDKSGLRSFLLGYFLAHPKLELIVTIESLQFPVDGLAQAVVSVAAVELGDPGMRRLKVELRRVGGDWLVVRADRQPQ